MLGWHDHKDWYKKLSEFRSLLRREWESYSSLEQWEIRKMVEQTLVHCDDLARKR